MTTREQHCEQAMSKHRIIGQLGGQANTPRQQTARRRNGRRAVGRPQRGHESRRTLLRDVTLPCLVRGYAEENDGTRVHVVTWLVDTEEARERFIRNASSALEYRVIHDES